MLIFPISLIATFFSITPFYCFLWACFLDSFLASQVPGVPFLLFWYSPVKHIPPPSVIGWGFYLHIWVVCILEFPFSLVLFLMSPLYIFLNAYFWLCWKLSALVLSLIYTWVLSHWPMDDARSCSGCGARMQDPKSKSMNPLHTPWLFAGFQGCHALWGLSPWTVQSLGMIEHKSLLSAPRHLLQEAKSLGPRVLTMPEGDPRPPLGRRCPCYSNPVLC